MKFPSPIMPCRPFPLAPRASSAVRTAVLPVLTLIPVLAVLAVVVCAPAWGLEHVLVRRGDKQHEVSGRVVITAEDGGILLAAQDGVLWRITQEQIVERRSDERTFVPLGADQAAERLLGELPPGFEVFRTKNFVICHDTSRAYAQWCGGLFERLYRAFENFWSNRGFELRQPEFPLVAVLFADRARYIEYTRPELGDAAGSIVGYYSLDTNRVVMYELTGLEAMRQAGDRRGSLAEITRMLSRPEAQANVATIIHEATHQLLFNTGMQQRWADIPLWLSEGLAMYFETPDLNSTQGWRTIGAVSRPRLTAFQRNLPDRPAGSLASLLADDQRFRTTRDGAAAYAEAWALNYFLIRRFPKQYNDYLKMLAEKTPLVWATPDERLREFRAAFGEDLDRLEAEFLRFVAQLR
jgi:hypothetical protein